MKKLSTPHAVREAARSFLDERGLDLSDGRYRPYTTHELKELGLGPNADCAGLVIPYCDVKGAPTDFYRFRHLEQPTPTDWDKLTARGKAERRYWQPPNTPPRVYFPPKFSFNNFFGRRTVHDRTMVVTEGELKADAAAKRGIACIALGGCWNFLTKRTDQTTGEQVTELLPDLARLPWQGMEVHLCFDSDAVTNTDVLRARDALAERLEALGARVFIKTLPQLSPGAKTGLDDYLKRKGKKAFLALPAERWYGPNVPQLVVRTKDDFLKHEYREREEILRSDAACLMRHPSIVQIHAWRGVGKSQLAVRLGGALARKDGEFFRWRSKRPLRVLYVDGEQMGVDGQEIVRLQAADAPSDNFRYLNLEDQPTFSIPKIVTAEGRAALERCIEQTGAEVLILDSLSTLANVSMNDEQNQLVLGDWFVRLRTGLRVTVIYLQHDGKTGQQRGHSKHEDWIDLSIHLTWPPDYHGAEGLRAHFKIDKARKPIADGQNMRITFGPSLTNPRQSEWSFRPLSKEEEKSGDLLTAATLLLHASPNLSNRQLSNALRQRGHKFKNKSFSAIAARARELRAKSDTTSRTGEKKPKY